jgi:hypothetical protein
MVMVFPISRAPIALGKNSKFYVLMHLILDLSEPLLVNS